MGSEMAQTARSLMNVDDIDRLDKIRLDRRPMAYVFHTRISNWGERRMINGDYTQIDRHFWGTENRYDWGPRWTRGWGDD
jgi:hypothetical protein